ncbi:MAG TPA: arginine decarboxylase, pyruvoyl-dependent [Candidatus Latescibacteria bacterium]|nr:arginine decarboxylase, pyruvoyl-dependent [Candidatus Latescibacterota bacterium]
MSALVPAKVFLTKGQGRHKEKLVSFELALREAGIAPFNLVRVSSIYPPHCRTVSKDAGLRLLEPGQVLFVVLSENATDAPGGLISASIGMAVPDDPSRYGYLAEHSNSGKSEKETGRHTEYLAAEMLATKLGKKLRRPDGGKPSQAFKISNGLSLRTRSVTQTATGAAGSWTTALAAAVLILEP